SCGALIRALAGVSEGSSQAASGYTLDVGPAETRTSGTPAGHAVGRAEEDTFNVARPRVAPGRLRTALAFAKWQIVLPAVLVAAAVSVAAVKLPRPAEAMSGIFNVAVA